MKYEYEFEIIYPGRQEQLLMKFKDEPTDLLTCLLHDIYDTIGLNHIRECLDKVIDGESNYANGGTMAYCIEVYKEKTKITGFFDDSDDECEVDTAELRRLVDIWWEEYCKFSKEKSAKYHR